MGVLPEQKKKTRFFAFLKLFVTICKLMLIEFLVIPSLAIPFYPIKKILTILFSFEVIGKDF